MSSSELSSFEAQKFKVLLVVMFNSFFGTGTTTTETKAHQPPAATTTTNMPNTVTSNVAFPSSERYLRQRQKRMKNVAETQESSNQRATRVGKHALALDKEMSSHASVVRAFKRECTRLPKQSLAGLESKVMDLLPAIQRVEMLLKEKKTTTLKHSLPKATTLTTRRLSLFGSGSKETNGRPRSNTVKIRGMSEDTFSEDEDCV